MLRETTGIVEGAGVHFTSKGQVYCNGNSQESTRVTLAKTPSVGIYRA